MKTPFDNNKYLKIQRENILKRIAKFGDKLYLEFGGKLFDDYHAARVLPGFQPDSKLQMLLGIKDKAEIVIVVNANDINSNKVRGDIGITYQEDVLRLIDTYQEYGLYVSSVVISFYQEYEQVLEFEKLLKNNDILLRIEPCGILALLFICIPRSPMYLFYLLYLSLYIIYPANSMNFFKKTPYR